MKWVREKADLEFDDNGKPVSAIGFTQDITDRKSMEESLAIEKKRLTMLLEAFPGFIYLQASDYSVRFANQYFIEHFGNPRYRPCYEVFRNRETPCEPCHTFKVFETKMPQIREWSEAPDGKCYMIHDYPFIDIDGSELVLEIGMDITMLKQAEERLKDYSQRLEEMVEERTQELKKVQEELIEKERLAVLGHFAGSISHELRNPLAAIDAAAYYLEMKLVDSNDKIRRHLKTIFENVKKSTDIIQSLLNLSRMEKPKTEKTDLTELVSETVHSSNIPEKIELILNFPDESVFLEVENEQIRMALKNIINNAVQAMDEKGKLTILIRSPRTGYIEIHIADTGNGILPEHTEKIFEPLFSTKTHGIGFGLSITKMIVENHEGTIHVESNLGKGATFIITFPLVLNDEGEKRDENSIW